MIKTLQSPESSERMKTIEVLSEAPDPRAIAPLTKVLEEDEDSWVRAAAAEALAV